MTNETNQDPLYRNLNEIYQEREKLFQQREQDYLKQKNALNKLLESMKQEKETLNQKEQELKQQQEALHIDEQNQQSRYQQLCEERKQLEHDKEELNKKEQEFEAAKDSMEVRYQVQIEKAKNMEIQAKQTKESFEHKLDMLGLILDADGKPGGEATQFFESLLSGMNKRNEEDLQSLEKMKRNMKNADIDMLKTGGRVGVINACLRIKMVTESKAVFDVDSEEGCGTTVMIKIPETYL